MGVTEWCDVSEGSALWELLSGVMLVRVLRCGSY